MFLLVFLIKLPCMVENFFTFEYRGPSPPGVRVFSTRSHPIPSFPPKLVSHPSLASLILHWIPHLHAPVHPQQATKPHHASPTPDNLYKQHPHESATHSPEDGQSILAGTSSYTHRFFSEPHLFTKENYYMVYPQKPSCYVLPPCKVSNLTYANPRSEYHSIDTVLTLYTAFLG